MFFGQKFREINFYAKEVTKNCFREIFFMTSFYHIHNFTNTLQCIVRRCERCIIIFVKSQLLKFETKCLHFFVKSILHLRLFFVIHKMVKHLLMN